MLLPRQLNSYKYINETKDVLFVLFGFHINMDVSRINAKKGKKMNVKKIKPDECSESKKKSIESRKEDK